MKKRLILSFLCFFSLTICIGQKDTAKNAKKPATQTTTTQTPTNSNLPAITHPSSTQAVKGNRAYTPKVIPKTGLRPKPTVRTRSLEPLKVRCGNDYIVDSYFENPTLVMRSLDECENFCQTFMKDEIAMTKAMQQTYYIPVVFHVMLTNGEQEIPLTQCQSALDKVNEDFNALNSDLNTVNPAFAEIAGKVNIKFILAYKDPKGNDTNGVIYYETRSGYGSPSTEEEIANIAWDNTKYMNVYLMEDLYGDGVKNNSGVSWYPDAEMNKRGAARIVFNYLYLGDNGASVADGEFQSVFTHECGHWLNLRHTFSEGSCDDGDRVTDTPPTDVAAAGCGEKTSRCGNLINYENYMDYNAECYKMFTREQTHRMVAALNHTARKTVWQNANLASVGILETANVGDKGAIINYEYSNKKFSADVESLQVISEASKNVVATPKNPKDVDMATLPKGVYTMKMKKGTHILKVRVSV